ncbi:collagen alpha-1(III) chain-like [Tetranychus urticae]|uniref:collagen alpha-1(III) chain-like n=1 Tax=Tetranychus urticae TaxID=32264 RepID=UPI00077C0498|nr:collagen alpha-1(III) chain-like [Tetranychus urticae]XP_015793729.1 collagen alpha-1(III) chain-like [Tetranychus urticae]
MNRYWIVSCEFFILFCFLTNPLLADDSSAPSKPDNDTSITKRLGLVNYLFPEPSELASSSLSSSLNGISNPLSRSSINGHWIFPQNSRNLFSIASLVPGGTTMDLAESVPRFSYSRFMKDAGVPSLSGFNDTLGNSSSAYSEYGRRNGGSPGSVTSSPNNNQQNGRESTSGQSRSDGNDDVDIDAELKAADKVVESAIESGSDSSPSSTPGPLGDGRGFRPGMRSRPMRGFRPGGFDGHYGPNGYRMRGLSANGGPSSFSPIRGLAGGPGLWSPSGFPLSAYQMGAARSPFNMGMKSGHLSDFANSEGARGNQISMNPLLWNEIDALTASAGASGASVPGSASGHAGSQFDVSAFPLSGLMGAENYPSLIGGPNPLGLFPLPAPSSSANGQLHPSASTTHGQILPSPLQAPGAPGLPGLSGSLPGVGLAGLPPAMAPGTPGAPGADASLADLQKAHPGLHPEQYQYLQQWYNYLNQPSIKSYVDSFRDPEDSSSSSSNNNGAKSGSSPSSSSSSNSDANKDGNRPWFRNLRLFPNMDMSRLQLPRVREMFRNFRTGLGSPASTSTTTESSTGPFNV